MQCWSWLALSSLPQTPPFTIGKFYVLLSKEAQNLLSWLVVRTWYCLLCSLRAPAVMSHPAPYIAIQYYCHASRCAISQYLFYHSLWKVTWRTKLTPSITGNLPEFFSHSNHTKLLNSFSFCHTPQILPHNTSFPTPGLSWFWPLLAGGRKNHRAGVLPVVNL